MIKAVIFDLDGTLVNSIKSISDSMNFILKKYGFPTHSDEKYKIFVGEGMDELVHRALPENEIKNRDIDRFIKEYREIYGKFWRKSIKPFPGIISMLKELNKKKISLFVLSNKSDHYTKLQVKELFGDINFINIYGAVEGIPRKPDPSAAVKMLKKNNISPSETAFVGDTSIDIITALNGNMKPIGVSWGFRTKKELNDSGAEKILKKPADIFSIL